MKLARTFHAVGQGAFYTERFYEGDENLFNVVYDCGSESAKKYINNAINRFCEDSEEVDKTHKPKIDLMFVSHFHDDHVNGISSLMDRCDVGKLVVPFMSLEAIIEVYIYNIIASNNPDNAANSFLIRCLTNHDDRVIRIPNVEIEYDKDNVVQQGVTSVDSIMQKGLNLGKIWEYIPFNITGHKISSFILAFQTKYKNLYDAFQKNDYAFVNAFFSSSEEIKNMRSLYKDHFKKLNESSMAVLSKPVRDLGQRNALCLYTGDYPMRSKLCVKELISFYNFCWDRIGTIQVPHHGASNDNPSDLYDGVKRECVMCYGTGNRYRHPGKNTINNIKLSGSILKEVTQNTIPEMEQIFEL